MTIKTLHCTQCSIYYLHFLFSYACFCNYLLRSKISYACSVTFYHVQKFKLFLYLSLPCCYFCCLLVIHNYSLYNFTSLVGSPRAQWVTRAKWVTFRFMSFSPNKTGVIIESCQNLLHHPIFF